ncbi:MAG: YkvA family protein [Kiritimatiellota bacterium]|nr:YkvA family protein [Kiritimatiellota bacterium]
MANKHDIINNPNSGFFQDLVLRIKLILRLIGDRRVNFLVKLLPIAAAIYVISPVDLIPGAVFPVIGALDDAVVIWLGTTLFVTLCPDDVVQEHTNALQKVVTGTWRDAPQQDEVGEIIDTGPREVQNDDE